LLRGHTLTTSSGDLAGASSRNTRRAVGGAVPEVGAGLKQQRRRRVPAGVLHQTTNSGDRLLRGHTLTTTSSRNLTGAGARHRRTRAVGGALPEVGAGLKQQRRRRAAAGVLHQTTNSGDRLLRGHTLTTTSSRNLTGAGARHRRTAA